MLPQLQKEEEEEEVQQKGLMVTTQWTLRRYVGRLTSAWIPRWTSSQARNRRAPMETLRGVRKGGGGATVREEADSFTDEEEDA